jgi:threonine dehydratase
MISFKGIVEASKVLEGVAIKSPLIYNSLLSNRYGCHVWLKREDLQPVRSYKIRGAYNKMEWFAPVPEIMHRALPMLVIS